MPQQYRCLRAVPAYPRFIQERFERCLDLYLCPRQRKMRVRAPQTPCTPLPKVSQSGLGTLLCLSHCHPARSRSCSAVGLPLKPLAYPQQPLQEQSRVTAGLVGCWADPLLAPSPQPVLPSLILPLSSPRVLSPVPWGRVSLGASPSGQRGPRGPDPQAAEATGPAALPHHPGAGKSVCGWGGVSWVPGRSLRGAVWLRGTLTHLLSPSPGLPWAHQPGALPQHLSQRAVAGIR